MRTAQEILNDFKKLGCNIKEVENQIFMTTSVKNKYWLDIEINTDILFVYVYSAGIDFVFIPLLNELIECLKESNK